VTTPVAERGEARRSGRGIGGAAIVIGALTVLAGVVGFGRQLVFAHTVYAGCVGTAYVTANQVPNIIYDIVLGGALTSAVVPVLAGPVARAARGAGAGDPSGAGGAGDAGDATAEARAISAALLTWTVVLLVPAGIVVALVARPVVSLLIPAATPSCAHAATVDAGTRMLIAFAPQIPLYGVAVVLYGILQSHRRFTAPALAPVLSSIVVAAAYFGFYALGNGYQQRPGALPGGALLVLSLGTTAGVLALALTAGIPVARLRLGLRPTLSFPPGVAARIRGLALVGIVTLVAQDLSSIAAIVLANGRGVTGAVVLYSYGWQVFFMVYAGLAVPVATSAFPVLSAQAGDTASPADALRGDAALPGTAAPPEPLPRPRPGAFVHDPAPHSAHIGRDHGQSMYKGEVPAAASQSGDTAPDAGFDATAAGATRAVLLMSWLGAALLAGACVPLARLFVGASQARQLAAALAAFAPGVVGYGVTANLSRVLFACGRTRAAAAALTGGWLLVIAAEVVIAESVPRSWVVTGLGFGTVIGLTGAGLGLVWAVRRARGRSALRGVGRAALAGLAGAIAGAAAGAGVSVAVPVGGFLPNVAVTLLACGVAAAVFLLVALLADGGDLRAVGGKLGARLGWKLGRA
jgi:putative peptidoglycan lipid II flippase